MSPSPVPKSASRRVRLASAAIGALAAVAIVGPSVSDAACSGPTCPFGSGYTLDRNFDCGAITTAQSCYFPGTTNIDAADYHHFGWGSSDYDGGGDVEVAIAGLTSRGTRPIYSYGFGYTRACYNTGCDAQGSENMKLSVFWYSGGTERHTIKGRGRT